MSSYPEKQNCTMNVYKNCFLNMQLIEERLNNWLIMRKSRAFRCYPSHKSFVSTFRVFIHLPVHTFNEIWKANILDYEMNISWIVQRFISPPPVFSSYGARHVTNAHYTHFTFCAHLLFRTYFNLIPPSFSEYVFHSKQQKSLQSNTWVWVFEKNHSIWPLKNKQMSLMKMHKSTDSYIFLCFMLPDHASKERETNRSLNE